MTLNNITLLEPNGPQGKLERREPPPLDMLESGEQPVVNGYRWINDTERGLFMSVTDYTPNTLKSRPFPQNEFMLVLEGSVAIVEPDGHERFFRAGDCFIFPQGSVRQWKQTEYFREYAVGFKDASWQKPEDANSIRYLPIELDALLEEVSALSVASVVGPMPIQHERKWFADPTGRMTVRVWDTTACQCKPATTNVHEWTHVLDGSITLTDAEGVAHHFKRGDTFIVPVGAVYGWQCAGYFRAIDCTLRPEAI